MAKIELDYSAFNALLHVKTTKKFCADYLGVSEDTIDRRLKEDHQTNFREYHNLKMQRTAVSLQQKAISMAQKGDKTMLVFCLKNMAGWTDKQETQLTAASISIIIDSDDAKV